MEWFKKIDKKYLIISGAILFIVTIAVISLFVFKNSSNQSAQNKNQEMFSFLLPNTEEKIPEQSTFTDTTKPNQTQQTAQQEKIGATNLIQITNDAVSGAVFNSDKQKIQYFKKNTGYIYEINPDKTGKKQITITTIPKIYKAFWSPNSDKCLISYLNTEEGQINENLRFFAANSISTTTEGVFLQSNTTEAAVSPVSEEIFYLLDNGSGITANFENQKQKEVFSLPFYEFTVNWPQKNTITLLTKPSSLVEGYFYKLNPKTGDFVKLMGGINGLTAVYSPVDEKIIYSKSAQKSIETRVYDSVKKTFSDYYYKTLPEKCFFSSIDKNIVYCAIPHELPPANYPDDWYKGKVSFSDDIWKINLNLGSNEIILENSNMDIINIFSDKTESYLFFTNKKDETLWSFKLSSEKKE